MGRKEEDGVERRISKRRRKIGGGKGEKKEGGERRWNRRGEGRRREGT